MVGMTIHYTAIPASETRVSITAQLAGEACARRMHGTARGVRALGGDQYVITCLRPDGTTKDIPLTMRSGSRVDIKPFPAGAAIASFDLTEKQTRSTADRLCDASHPGSIAVDVQPMGASRAKLKLPICRHPGENF